MKDKVVIAVQVNEIGRTRFIKKVSFKSEEFVVTKNLWEAKSYKDIEEASKIADRINSFSIRKDKYFCFPFCVSNLSGIEV